MKNFIKWTTVAIVLIAISIAAVHFLEYEADKNIQKDIKTEMLQVQARAKVIYEEYHVDNNNGLKGEQMEDSSLEQQFDITEISKFYKWTKENLQEIGFSTITLKDDEFYLVNYETEEVVYSNGYKAENGEIYYKLSSIKNIGVTENDEVIEEGENVDDGEGESEASESQED